MSDVREGLRKLRRDATTGAEEGLQLGSEHVLGVAVDQTPIEESTLGRSGKATQEGLRAAVSFNTPYAVVQHEDMSLAHDPGRTAKYLEKALNSERVVVGKIIATAVRRRIGS